MWLLGVGCRPLLLAGGSDFGVIVDMLCLSALMYGLSSVGMAAESCCTRYLSIGCCSLCCRGYWDSASLSWSDLWLLFVLREAALAWSTKNRVMSFVLFANLCFLFFILWWCSLGVFSFLCVCADCGWLLDLWCIRWEMMEFCEVCVFLLSPCVSVVCEVSVESSGVARVNGGVASGLCGVALCCFFDLGRSSSSAVSLGGCSNIGPCVWMTEVVWVQWVCK